MTVTYVFENLKSLADSLDLRAKQVRDSAARHKPRSIKFTQYASEAAMLEGIAEMLRDTKLRTDADVITDQ